MRNNDNAIKIVDSNINGSIWRSSKKFTFCVHRPTKKKKKPVGKSVIISDIEMREPKWRSPCTWKWEKLKKVGGMKYHSPEVKIKSGTVGLTKWS